MPQLVRSQAWWPMLREDEAPPYGDNGKAKARIGFPYFSCRRLSPDLADLGLRLSLDPSPKLSHDPRYTLNPKS